MDKGKNHIASLIRDKAGRLGFDGIGFSPASELPGHKDKLLDWLLKGYNAGMGYMANHFEKRVNPSILVEGSLSVITVLKNYYPDNQSLSKSYPKISRYAHGEDYHEVIKQKLSLLFKYIREHAYHELEGRCFVDSAPLLERSIAARAGLGWIGKNSMLINRELGSYTFIAEMVVNIELPYANSVEEDGCRDCTRCIDSCPTSAILPGRQVNANLCISYQNIENKSEIPPSLRSKFNNWVFGCDICQEVCPWNRRAKPHQEPRFNPSPGLLAMTSAEWENLTPERFNSLFGKTALKRIKFEGLARNISFLKNVTPS